MTEEKKKPDQVAFNIEFYGQVFQKCLDAAGKIVGDKNYERMYKIAELLFERFFADQSAIKGTESQTRAMVDGLHSVLENRNR